MTTAHAHGISAALVPAGSGRVLMEGPLGAVLLAGADDTHGAASFVVHPMAPRTLGSPLHTHTHEDEWTYVLDGTVGIQVGDDVVLAGAGDLVLKPRGTAHAFWNATDQQARLLEVITPGGFETYFEGLGRILSALEPDLAALGELAARHAVSMDPSSVPRLMAEHGLRG